jgi:Acyl-coenzyme A synthetases/AMP-(fatty) acid ligases
MRWLGSDGERAEFTFGQLAVESSRFAAVLAGLGVAPGARVFIMLPKLPEVFVAFLGCLKARVVVGPLFANFGDDALLDRLGDARACVLLTKHSLLKKVQRIRDRLPDLRHILLVDVEDHLTADILSYRHLMREASADFPVVPTSPETPSLLHYTSGSTGKPKGVLHVHGALPSIVATTRDVLQVGPGDVLWCTADPGWVTGTSYGMVGPWAVGATQVHYSGSFDAGAWMTILEQERVNVWYTAPTALRMLMREEASLYAGRRLDALFCAASVGEPLNPEITFWARRTLGKEIHDTWFQTETGAIMIANRPGLAVRPGSMGKAVDGVEAVILDSAGQPLPAGQQGRLCLRRGWPSMFAQYLNRPEVYASRFHGEYYDSGDMAVRDADGYFWFVGRTDDAINTSGHLVGPFEIESVLLELAEVAEAAAVSAPDPIRFEKVVVFVCLRSGNSPSRELESRIRLHVANRVSSIASPQDVVFVPSLPRNRSGKIMRRVLRARFLGQDEGDLSSMETWHPGDVGDRRERV